MELTFHAVDGAPVSDANLKESYAMSFSYGDDGGVTGVSTEEISAQGDKSVNMRDVKQDAQSLLGDVVYHLLRSNKFKEKLPSKFTVLMLDFD